MIRYARMACIVRDVPFERKRGEELIAALFIATLVQGGLSFFVGGRARAIAFGVTLVVILVLFEYQIEIDELFLRRDRRLVDELARLALSGEDPERARKLARKLLRGSLLVLPDTAGFRKALEHAGPLQAA